MFLKSEKHLSNDNWILSIALPVENSKLLQFIGIQPTLS